MRDLAGGRIMGFNCGIVGLPNVGKSALFNALTATQAAEATKYPFSTREANVGRVAVPDERLEVCARHLAVGEDRCRPRARIRRYRRAGPRRLEGARAPAASFLGHLREVDAIAHILRCFEDDNVVHVEGSVDPIRDAETVETELMLADLDSLERRLVAAQKRARGGDREAKAQLLVIEPILAGLQGGTPARAIALAPDQQGQLRLLQLPDRFKPVLYIANVDEGDRRSEQRGEPPGRRLRPFARGPGGGDDLGGDRSRARPRIAPSLDERHEFLAALGLAETGLTQVIRAGYSLLDLITYFTAGPKESKAWTIPRGTKAPQAAAVIHTDFEKGFIRAETIPYAPISSRLRRRADAKDAAARCGSKAPITASSKTATSCISASMCDVAHT